MPPNFPNLSPKNRKCTCINYGHSVSSWELSRSPIHHGQAHFLCFFRSSINALMEKPFLKPCTTYQFNFSPTQGTFLDQVTPIQKSPKNSLRIIFSTCQALGNHNAPKPIPHQGTGSQGVRLLITRHLQKQRNIWQCSCVISPTRKNSRVHTI